MYLMAIAFNRLVPERCFRFRRFDVFELPAVELESQRDSSAYIAESKTDHTEAQKLTGYDRELELGTQTTAIIKQDGKTVAAIWIGEEEFLEAELGLVIELKTQQRWLFSAYVDKQYRRQGLYRELLNFVTCESETFQDSGRCSDSRTFLLAINPDNRRSMNAHRKLGARRIARVTAWRFWNFARVSAACKSNRWRASVDRNQSSDCRNKPTRIRFARQIGEN